MKKTLRVLLADDHDIVIEGVRRVLNHPGFEIVGVVNDGRSLLHAAQQLRPDVIITDVTMPFLNGIDAVRQIRQTNPDVKDHLSFHASRCQLRHRSPRCRWKRLCAQEFRGE